MDKQSLNAATRVNFFEVQNHSYQTPVDSSFALDEGFGAAPDAGADPADRAYAAALRHPDAFGARYSFAAGADSGAEAGPASTS
jgi:hypothetical protein